MLRETNIPCSLNYELVRVIAHGGMGTVYEAVQSGTDNFKKVVGIKLVLEKYSSVQEFRDNFVGEAKLVADLIHTNIVQTYHLGKHGQQYFMVMEYVNGINLEEFTQRHVETDKKLPVDLAVFIVSRICRGLAYAHQKKDRYGKPLNIVHRDVNPKNIMIAFEGDVKLTDFGLAKARKLMFNQEGHTVIGKNDYLSPEQVNMEVTDGRADLFACGIVLAELLLGVNIFEGQDDDETHKNITEGALPEFTHLDERIDPPLNDILHKSLAKNRDERYNSSEDMMTALERYLYSDGYGPTNEKLALYLRELFEGSSLIQEREFYKSMREE